LNAITDVIGIQVGHITLISGEGKLKVGEGPVRTGVTAILPRGKQNDPVFAGWYVLNGNGEITGAAWVEESGFLEGPIMLTNTHSVGVVRDAVVSWIREIGAYDPEMTEVFWSLPVVTETYDGILNDINGFHVKPKHVFKAIERARGGPVKEGNVGGGTGMICYSFKGGIGTASRKLPDHQGGFTIGVIVQTNYGERHQLTVAGAPVGREITDLMPEIHAIDRGPRLGSFVAVVATDAPLLPHQLKRLARRAPLGMARVGGYGANTSGDIFLAFSTANPGAARRSGLVGLSMLPNDRMTPLFDATAQAIEEAIINSLVAAETMCGINANTVYALPHDRLQAALEKYCR
jgi:L-aminopeptidase/D-esterase-like protein